MRALTIWQPWASLIMIGAKPIEFRDWDYRTRYPKVEGARIVIQAGARPVKLAEVEDMLARCWSYGRLTPFGAAALPLLQRLQAAYKCRGVVELAAGLGTAVLGTPRLIDGLFDKPDSDRLMHHQWAWPLSDIEPFAAPVPARGAQGFWHWPGGNRS